MASLYLGRFFSLRFERLAKLHFSVGRNRHGNLCIDIYVWRFRILAELPTRNSVVLASLAKLERRSHETYAAFVVEELKARGYETVDGEPCDGNGRVFPDA